MHEALREVGLRKVLRYAVGQLISTLCRSSLLLPPLRTLLLRLGGARIGPHGVLHPCTLFNLYRRGLRGLTLGHHCFIGEECLLDLAEGISLADHVTLAERVTILTHTNVGYRSHPLQATLPARTAPVTIGSGSFVGTNVTILPGVAIGECAIIGACSLVRDDVPSGVKVAGVPARIID